MKQTNGSERGRFFAFLSYDTEHCEDRLLSLQNKIAGWAGLHDNARLGDDDEDETFPEFVLAADYSDMVAPAFVKPHYHVLLDFGPGAKVSARQVYKICGDIVLNGVVYKVVNHWRYGAYLVHANSPEKHQYDPDRVLSFGGAKPYKKFLEECMREIGEPVPFQNFIRLCEHGDIKNFRELAHVLRRFYPHWLGSFAELDLRQQGLLERILRGECRASRRIYSDGFVLFPFDGEKAEIDELVNEQQVLFGADGAED